MIVAPYTRPKHLTSTPMIGSGGFVALALLCVVGNIYLHNKSVGRLSESLLVQTAYAYLACLVGAVMFVRVVRGVPSSRERRELIAVTVFFVWATAVVLLGDHNVRGYRELSGLDITRTNMRVLVQHAMLFAVGYSLIDLFRFNLLIRWGFVLLVTSSLINIDPTTLLIDKRLMDEEARADYLFLGDTFALWALLTCAVVLSRWGRVMVVVASLASLAVLSSRTSLYAFALSVPFVFRASLRCAIGAIAVLVVAAFGVSSLLENVSDTSVLNRMLVSVAKGEDASAAYRLEQFESVGQLAENWLLGDYAGQVRDFGSLGAYLHNGLSYWQQFGLIPFLIVLILWVMAASRARYILKADEAWDNPDKRFFLLAVVFFTIEVVGSRSYVHSLPWLVLGQSVALAHNAHYRFQRRPLANA